MFLFTFSFLINEPTERVYRLMHLFIYDENRLTETVSLFMFNTHCSDTAKANKTTKYARAELKRNDFSILIDSHFYEPLPISLLKSQSMLFSVDE